MQLAFKLRHFKISQGLCCGPFGPKTRRLFSGTCHGANQRRKITAKWELEATDYYICLTLFRRIGLLPFGKIPGGPRLPQCLVLSPSAEEKRPLSYFRLCEIASLGQALPPLLSSTTSSMLSLRLSGRLSISALQVPGMVKIGHFFRGDIAKPFVSLRISAVGVVPSELGPVTVKVTDLLHNSSASHLEDSGSVTMRRSMAYLSSCTLLCANLSLYNVCTLAPYCLQVMRSNSSHYMHQSVPQQIWLVGSVFSGAFLRLAAWP
mmetsp:Transcript_102315/g.330052  ORF Transcript_102315/g.330052 Transcript_102315/m.330052 type:complete len:263 (+) Transcript_102315:178-966(+)